MTGSRWLLGALVLLPVVLLFADLGTPALWDPDEGRHAEIAREMRLTGDWLGPQLNFEPYRQKLPPFYWLMAFFLGWSGMDAETAARLPSALFALAGVWCTAAWGWRRYGSRAGVLAGIVLASSAGYVGAGRLALIDGPFSVLLALSLFTMFRPLVEERAGFPFAFWLSLTAATALRGPVALLLAALVATVFVLWIGEPRRLQRLRPGRGLLLSAGLLAPLAFALTARDPGYLPAFLWRYNVLRFASPSLPGSHEESVLYYFWMVPLLLLPWTLFAPAVVRTAWRDPRHAEASRFLLSWLLIVGGFFSISAAKLPAYALPLLFPMALLTGAFLDRALDRPPPRSPWSDPVIAGGAILFLAILVAPFAGHWAVERAFPMYADRTFYLFLLVPLAIPGLAAVAMRHRAATLACMVACTAGTILGLYRFGATTVSAYNSLEVPAMLVADALPEDVPLLSFGTTTHSLAFYAKRPVRLLESLSEVGPTVNGETPAALLTKKRHLPEIRGVLDRSLYYWWEGDSRKVLLANRPPPPGADARILLPRSRHAKSELSEPADREP